ncbi:hypothetical protein DE146DRAFT_730091 [Phaeosphaeria sp. MPI-PUGE-AT-0046c]|nr:hypothetical protein DE146DRAFT_730091 [Phaeosphaeria sp. MPI-PUGE-AT-0046c]
MKFTLAVALSLASLAFAAPSPQNAGRPVPNGACCTPNTSLKQDVCNVNGQSGRCVPSGANGCGGALTCIEDNRLTCDANTLERGRPRCRLTGEGA